MTERNLVTLAILLRDAVNNFYIANRNNTSISPAKALLNSILPFLWGASNAKIEATPRIADMDDDEVQKWGEHMHNTFLLPPSTISTTTTNQGNINNSALVLAPNIENKPR